MTKTMPPKAIIGLLKSKKPGAKRLQEYWRKKLGPEGVKKLGLE